MIGKIIRDYKIIDVLGGGGMSEVYLAQRADGMLKRNAVIKIVGAHLPTEERLRFIGEMHAQERLNHPNIAQIFDAGQLEDGRPFMIIEYVGGQSLRDLLIDQKSNHRPPKVLPLELVVEITEQACAGLNEAHQRKIVHRDIKPENIIIRKDGDKYKIKIIDFGIAISQENGILPTRKTTAGVIGTPEYISPEQLMPEKYYLDKPGEKPGFSADIYAFGIVIYEMLTGTRPFSGSGFELALKHTREIPLAPSKIRPDLNIPESVDQVVLKSLAKQPGERQKSINLLAQELKTAIETKRETEVLSPQSDFLTTESEAKQVRESLIPVAENKNITSKSARLKYLWVLPIVFLSGLLILLLYFKPWERISDNLVQSQSLPASTSDSPGPSAPIAFSTINVSLVRRGKAGMEEPVALNTAFYSGEGVRVSIQTEQNGFLYILLLGSSGKVSMLYPDPRISSGNNQIDKGKKVNIPTNTDWFKFDKNPGVETIYLVFAENKTEGIINELEKARTLAKIVLPTELTKEAVDLATIGGSLKGRGKMVGLLKLLHQP
jgi:serine/threonine protein kinase